MLATSRRSQTALMRTTWRKEKDVAQATAKQPDEIEVVLRLTMKEAEALKAFTQNEMQLDESKELSSIRYSIWHALDDAKVANP